MESNGERRKECRANKSKKAQDDEEHPSHSTYSFVITIYPHSFPFGGEPRSRGRLGRWLYCTSTYTRRAVNEYSIIYV